MENRTRAMITDEASAIRTQIKDLKAKLEALEVEDMLHCDDSQRYSEKMEVINVRDGKKRVKREALIGRIHWTETFKDEDSDNHISIERSQVVRVDGEWI